MIPHVEFFVFVSVLCLCACVGLLYHARRRRLRDVLQRRLGELRLDADPEFEQRSPDEARGLRHMLADSGLGWEVRDFVSRMVIASVTGLLCGLFLRSVFLALVLASVGSFGVLAMVRRAHAKRLSKCDGQMPQALEVMVLALRAGHALPNALAIAAAEAPAPISDELQRVVDEHALGRPVPEALQAMGERLPGCKTVNGFVVAVGVLRDTGGNLIAVIDRIVQNARARVSYETRLRALTAEGRTSAKLLAFMPVVFALFAGATDPTYADLMLNDGSGRTLMVVAFTWWLLGILLTRKLLKTSM